MRPERLPERSWRRHTPALFRPPISTAPEPSMVPIVIYLAAMVAITLALLFVILDLTGGSPTHH